MHYTQSCYCRAIKYEFDVSPDDARTSLCHCNNCKVLTVKSFGSHLYSKIHQKFFGTNYGLTTKIPASAFKITHGEPKVHEAITAQGVYCIGSSVGFVEVEFWSME